LLVGLPSRVVNWWSKKAYLRRPNISGCTHTPDPSRTHASARAHSLAQSHNRMSPALMHCRGGRNHNTRSTRAVPALRRRQRVD
jgi:hypothetical protein